MILALFALSLAMIVGGIASVIQGFPFVRLESGLAMTIAGATVASAGSVLLGLAVLARQIRGLARRSADESAPVPPRLEVPRAEVPVPPARTFENGMPETPSPGARRPLIAGAAGLAAGTAGGAYLGSEAHERPNPSFEASFEEPSPDPRSDRRSDPWPAPPEPLFPELADLDLAPTREAEPTFDPPTGDAAFDAMSPKVPADTSAQQLHVEEEPATRSAEEQPETALKTGPETDLFAPAVPVAAPAETDLSDEPELRPALTEEPADPETPAEPALAVVGTYVSGGNTYVMYSDGSIEADTPRGRFTFKSLDELKAFVEAGGETDRGAA
ncbi:MAG: hypothetical protein K2Y56_22720 [Methylobacterium sp.]|uniref:hypothetical protein n=1 Tax=Methylobacterium sp. TaxID=409 RepID=UPI0025E1EC65|nr:hypothetical protein [Methylobacterium sp.]MBX9934294.1 hypothetical protein [Methylobacterium sp.]